MNNNGINSHKDLDVWKKSLHLVTDIYRLTENFPEDEIYGLIAQMKRAAVSIPSNIAEGASRNSGKEFIQFLYIALGSASELETQLIISQKLSYIDNREAENYQERIEMLKKTLTGLITYLKKASIYLRNPLTD
jgi:four helix bundle protein